MISKSPARPDAPRRRRDGIIAPQRRSVMATSKSKPKSKTSAAKPAKTLRVTKQDADKVKGGLMAGPPDL
jgi:hypothetical protein